MSYVIHTHIRQVSNRRSRSSLTCCVSRDDREVFVAISETFPERLQNDARWYSSNMLQRQNEYHTMFNY